MTESDSWLIQFSSNDQSTASISESHLHIHRRENLGQGSTWVQSALSRETEQSVKRKGNIWEGRREPIILVIQYNWPQGCILESTVGMNRRVDAARIVAYYNFPQAFPAVTCLKVLSPRAHTPKNCATGQVCHLCCACFQFRVLLPLLSEAPSSCWAEAQTPVPLSLEASLHSHQIVFPSLRTLFSP